ncbi:hypothetical protein HQ560_14835, partial [bacterium]|nr:hypothetical protein [bacterium]
NVACPFGNAPQHQLGLERVRRIFGAKTEADAATVCRELGVRFILSTDSFLPVVLLDIVGAVHGAPACFATALQSDTPPSAHFTLVKEWTHPAPAGGTFKTRLFELRPPLPSAPATSARPPSPHADRGRTEHA